MREDKEIIRRALDESLAYLDERPSLQARIMNRLDEPESPRRHVRLTVAIAFAVLLALSVAAYAEYRWQVFSHFGWMFGWQEESMEEIMQHGEQSQTFGDVTITVEEMGYDGRTLLLAYSFKAEGDDTVYTDETVYDFLQEHGVGWWTDNMWINGEQVNMAGGSTQEHMPGDEPGEIVEIDSWWLYNEGVTLDGVVSIALPVGPCPDWYRNPTDEFWNSTKYFDENRDMRLPDSGVMTFTLDVTGVQARNEIAHPNIKTRTDMLTAWVTEVCFSPLMTYIDLQYELNEGVMEAYIAENGEGYYDENGKLMWPYGPFDVADRWLYSLALVDGQGNVLSGLNSWNGVGDSTAGFIVPYIEDLPDALYLAPSRDGQADMDEAVRLR